MSDNALALTLTGLILFALTNFFPLLALKAQGMTQELTLWKAVWAFWLQGFHVLALLLAANLILLPLFELLTLLWVLCAMRRQQNSATARFLYRWLIKLRPWGMLEVFMLGLLVALVKLGDMATLVVGPAFWSFAFLIVCMAAATAVLDPFVVWNDLGKEKSRVH